MGKFDKYKNKNFHLKGLIGVILFGVIFVCLLVIIIKRWNCKKRNIKTDSNRVRGKYYFYKQIR